MVSAFPRKVQAVVFDMDGLLFDTETVYRDAMIAAAEKHGHDMPMSLYLSTIGTTSKDTRELLDKHYGPKFNFDAVWAAAKERFDKMAEMELRLKPGVIELLNVLDAAGLPRAIATSSAHNSARNHLAMHGLQDRFDAVVGQGDYQLGKPNPDPFLMAAERLGIEPQFCLALEDSYNGVRAACTAGMMTVMVPDVLPATAEMEKLCIRIARDLHEVCGLVKASHL